MMRPPADITKPETIFPTQQTITSQLTKPAAPKVTALIAQDVPLVAYTAMQHTLPIQIPKPTATLARPLSGGNAVYKSLPPLMFFADYRCLQDIGNILKRDNEAKNQVEYEVDLAMLKRLLRELTSLTSVFEDINSKDDRKKSKDVFDLCLEGQGQLHDDCWLILLGRLTENDFKVNAQRVLNPLHKTIIYDRFEQLELLLKLITRREWHWVLSEKTFGDENRHTDPDHTDRTPLLLAIDVACSYTTLLLLDACIAAKVSLNEPGGDSANPLMSAVRLGELEIVETLIRHNADLFVRIKIYNTDLETEVVFAPLIDAIVCGMTEVAKTLIDAMLVAKKTKEVDKILRDAVLCELTTPKIVGLNYSIDDTAHKLLKTKTNKNCTQEQLINRSTRSVDVIMVSYLTLAILADEPEVAYYMLDKKFAVSDPRNIHTLQPIHAAIIQGNLELVQRLLQCGANPKAKINPSPHAYKSAYPVELDAPALALHMLRANPKNAQNSTAKDYFQIVKFFHDIAVQEKNSMQKKESVEVEIKKKKKAKRDKVKATKDTIAIATIEKTAIPATEPPQQQTQTPEQRKAEEQALKAQRELKHLEYVQQRIKEEEQQREERHRLREAERLQKEEMLRQAQEQRQREEERRAAALVQQETIRQQQLQEERVRQEAERRRQNEEAKERKRQEELARLQAREQKRKAAEQVRQMQLAAAAKMRADEEHAQRQRILKAKDEKIAAEKKQHREFKKMHRHEKDANHNQSEQFSSSKSAQSGVAIAYKQSAHRMIPSNQEIDCASSANTSPAAVTAIERSTVVSVLPPPAAAVRVLHSLPVNQKTPALTLSPGNTANDALVDSFVQTPPISSSGTSPIWAGEYKLFKPVFFSLHGNLPTAVRTMHVRTIDEEADTPDVQEELFGLKLEAALTAIISEEEGHNENHNKYNINDEAEKIRATDPAASVIGHRC